MPRKRRDSIEVLKMRKEGKLGLHGVNIQSAFSRSGGIFGLSSVTEYTVRHSNTEVYDFHSMNLAFLEEKFETNFESGLRRRQVAHFRRVYGPNKIQEIKEKPAWREVFELTFGGFYLLLWGAFCLDAVAVYVKSDILNETPYNKSEIIFMCCIILVALLLADAFAMFQEIRYKMMVSMSKDLLSRRITVLRDNIKMPTKVEELVPGDIIILREGDWVPADIRILECSGLKVDNSSITGHSNPQVRTNICTSNFPLETQNMLFNNTFVVEGSGKGVVVCIGHRTFMGKLANLTVDVQQSVVILKRELYDFTILMTSIITAIAIVFLIAGLILSLPPQHLFDHFVAILTSNVPSGLLLVLNTARIIVTRRMKKYCIVKNIHAIETLGQTSVICVDKTNTITQNVMTVSHLYYDSAIHDVLSKNYVMGYSKQFTTLCRAGVLCNVAKKDDQKVVTGDTIDVAVLKCMENITRDSSNVREAYPKVFEIPFSPTDRIHVTIHSRRKDSRVILFVKGAPEKILEKSTRLLIEDVECNMTKRRMTALKLGLQELGYLGERVIGFADCLMPYKYTGHYPFTSEPNFPIGDLRFLGFVSMYDPPRPDVDKAIKIFRKAGIRVVMITGDYPVTANTIAKKVGIISPEHDTIYDIAMRQHVPADNIGMNEAPNAAVICGSDLKRFKSYEFESVLEKYKEIVFARVNAKQKLRIVQALQQLNHVVTVIGDGVNDTLALKKANVGIATGKTSSKVAREIADIVLFDEDFHTITLGIREGRLIYDNLKKCIAYVLASNIPEIAAVMVYFIFGTPRIIPVVVIVFLNLGTQIWPAISLAFETSEMDAMKRPPRNISEDSLVDLNLMLFAYLTIGTAQTLAGLSSWFATMSFYGFLPKDLIGKGRFWYSDANDIVDSFGIEWTRADRIHLEKHGVSAYFLSIVFMQVVVIFVGRTRRLSIFEQGIFQNIQMFKAVLLQVCLACSVVYIPGVNSFFGFAPLHFFFIWPIMPFAIFLFVYEELRKYFIRRNPDGWLYDSTYY